MSFLKELAKAGLKATDKIGEIVEGAEQRSYGTQILSDDITPAPGGGIVIKAMEDDDLMALNKALEEGGFQGGLNMGRIGEIFENKSSDFIGPRPDSGEAGGFDLATILQNVKENNVELFNHLRRKKQSMETLMAIAEQTGFEQIQG